MATPYLQYGKDGLSGYDSTGVRRIWLDPGQLLLSFFDVDGTTPRVEIGNLPARGISPAHWGFRWSNSIGPVGDTLGLIQHTTPLGGSPITDLTGRTWVSIYPTMAQVPGSATVTFTLARPASVLFMAVMTMSCTTGPAFDLALAVDSTSIPDPASSRIVNDATPTIHPGTLLMVKALAAGTHTAYILADVNAGGANLPVIGFTWFSAFLLGG